MAFFGQQGGLITPTSFLSLEFFSYMSPDPGYHGGFHGQRPGGPTGRGRHAGAGYRTAHQPGPKVFWGKLLALLVSLTLILGLTWSGFAIGMGQGGTFDFSLWEMSRAFISLFAVLLVFLSLGAAVQHGTAKQYDCGSGLRIPGRGLLFRFLPVQHR